MRRWIPAIVLGLGAFFTVGPDRQHDTALRQSFEATVAASWSGFLADPVVLSEREREVAGVSAYLAREYLETDSAQADAASRFGIYIGFYESQTRGRTIHSPRNCLPGGGWEPLTLRREVLEGPYGPQPVNRYLIQNGDQLALVLYWYQGRGRIAANEYLVKWDLLRDAALHGRSEEALVRIVVPIEAAGEDAAWQLARRVADWLMYRVDEALPSWS